MKNKLLLSGVLTTIFISGAAIAGTPIHTWHNITAAKNQVWVGRLVIASADEGAYFTNAQGVNEHQIYDFTLNGGTPFRYGFGFDTDKTDFNVSYTLTLYKKPDTSLPQFTAKACVYNVTAKGPADPDILATPYNGAKCTWKVVPGVGEDFSVG